MGGEWNLQFPAGKIWGDTGHTGDGGSSDHFRRHRFQECKAYSRRSVRVQSEADKEQADNYDSALRRWLYAYKDKLRCGLALFCLVQPDVSNGCSLDHNGVSVPEKKIVLDNSAPGPLHDRGGDNIHHACPRRLALSKPFSYGTGFAVTVLFFSMFLFYTKSHTKREWILLQQEYIIY